MNTTHSEQDHSQERQKATPTFTRGAAAGISMPPPPFNLSATSGTRIGGWASGGGDSSAKEEEKSGTNTRGGSSTQNEGTTQRQAAGGGGGAARKAKLKSGPTYTPNGTITSTTRSAHFALAAEFEHDPENGIHASAGEIRQYIKWSAGERPNHAGFRPVASFPDNTWFEDRDASDKRYGHRAGPHTDPQSFDQYLDAAGNRDQANGHIYRGTDSPRMSIEPGTGSWFFKLQAIDTANGNSVLGEDNLEIDWQTP